MPEQVILAVRGEARHSVAPDHVVLHGRLNAFAPTKGEALAVVRAAQDELTAVLRRLGGVVLAVETERSALTWSMGSVSTHDERDFDPSGQARVFAAAEVSITARDLARLPEVADAAGRIDALHLDGVGWRVDPENPAWRDVRAAAIAAALAKGRDYAAALGATLRRVEQVADAGLLGGGDDRFGFDGAEPMVMTAFGGSPATPTLDPVPQRLQAVIEARLVADVPPLG